MPFYTKNQVAELLQIPLSRVERLLRSKQLRGVSTSPKATSQRPRYVIPAEALTEFVASRSSTAPKKRTKKQ